MSARRAILLLGAAVCWGAAFLIVMQVGLPERAVYTGQVTAGELPVAPEISAIAPPFERTTLKGEKLALVGLRGMPVIINFWATWCVPCRAEMPALQAVYEVYQARGLRVLAVNMGETADAARRWREELGLTFDILLDPQEAVAALYQLRGQPSTYVVSPNGIITHIFYGPTTQDGLNAALALFFPNG